MANCSVRIGVFVTAMKNVLICEALTRIENIRPLNLQGAALPANVLISLSLAN
jgi:hypothetical protein